MSFIPSILVSAVYITIFQCGIIYSLQYTENHLTNHFLVLAIVKVSGGVKLGSDVLWLSSEDHTVKTDHYTNTVVSIGL